MRTIDKIKLSVNELFSGVGMQRKGIENTGLFDVEVKCTSDIDINAIISYAALHCGLTKEMVDTYSDYPPREEMANDLSVRNIGFDFKTNKPYNWNKLIKSGNRLLNKVWLATKLGENLGDISKIERLPYADLWTVSFPCTDISVAGQLKGLSEGSNTRSSLLWQQIRLLRDSINRNESPKYIMFENVKSLVSKKFKPDFDKLLDTLSELGYNSYWEVLNAKFCGIPQNRERVFCISIRKDIDTGKMTFPKPFDNGLRLKDMLDDKVDEKFYINNARADKLIEELIENGTLPKACASRGRDTNDNRGQWQQPIEFRDDDVANSLTSATKDSMVADVPGCIRMERTEEGKHLRSAYESGELQHAYNEYKEPKIRPDGATNTLSTVQKDNLIVDSTAQHSTAQHSTAQHSTAQHSTGIDLTINNPKPIEIANCVMGKQRDITAFRSYNTGVLESNGALISKVKGDYKYHKSLDTAPVLCSRDYKGFAQQEMAGVIECKTEKTEQINQLSPNENLEKK